MGKIETIKKALKENPELFKLTQVKLAEMFDCHESTAGEAKRQTKGKPPRWKKRQHSAGTEYSLCYLTNNWPRNPAINEILEARRERARDM